jgi:peptidoglycan-N-acetylglucosamine deacetylase
VSARTAALVTSAALAGGWLLPAVTGVPVVTHRLRSGRPGATGRAVVALTFDDGPHPLGTPAILDLLAAAGATATFFVVGEQLARYPEVVRRAVAEGHEIAVHGWTHQCLLRRGPASTDRDLTESVGWITDLTGTRPTRFRPPYGVASAPALLACRQLQLTPTWWTAWGRDWSASATPLSVADLVLRSPVDTRMPTVLLHDSDRYAARNSWRTTVAATELLLAHWAAAGVLVRSLATAAIGF